MNAYASDAMGKVASVAPSELLPHLAATLKEAREDAGLTLRAMEEHGRERTSYHKLEAQAHGEGGSKYWANLDEFVTAYSDATGIPPYTLWTRAINRARKS